MAAYHFMIRDLLGTAAAFAVFPCFILIPGYVVGWAGDLFAFRRRRIVTRILLALVLSVAVSPIVTFLLARTAGFGAVKVALGLAALAFVGITVAECPRREARIRRTANSEALVRGAPLVVALVWIVLASLVIVDAGGDEKLFFSMVVPDYTKHISVTDAITRTGLPPVNPSFHPGKPIHLYYYYFWFMLCSLADQLGGDWISARTAVFGGTLWAGLALGAIVALYTRLLMPRDAGPARKAALAALGLLLVSGLDVIPVAVEGTLRLLAGRGYFYYDVELWNFDAQATAWTGAILWVPHHVAALVAGMVACLLIRVYTVPGGWRVRNVGALAAAGCALASAAGMSIWVSFVFALYLSVWIVYAVVKRWRGEAVLVVAVGVVAALLAARFILDLREASRVKAAPIAFTIRPFFPAERVLSGLGVRDPALRGLANLLMLPVNYGMELGFFALAGVLYWRARRGVAPDGDRVFLAGLLLTSLLAATFLRSSLKFNDLGWRGLMPAQFVLLLWAAEYGRHAQEPSPALVRVRWPQRLLTALLVLGVATSALNVILLRTYPMFADAKRTGLPPWFKSYAPLGERTRAMRSLYESLDRMVPRDAVVQYNPGDPETLVRRPGDVRDFYHELYGNRQTIAADPTYGPLYGVSREEYEHVALPIARMFARDDLAYVKRTCRAWGIDALIVKERDGVWLDRGSWVWRERPLIGNPYARVFLTKDLSGPDPAAPPQRPLEVRPDPP